MDQKLSQELSKKDKVQADEMKKMKTQVIAETKRFEETQKVEEISEIHAQNSKKLKKMSN